MIELFQQCACAHIARIARLSTFQVVVQLPMGFAACLVSVASLPHYSIAHPLETALVAALGLFHYRHACVCDMLRSPIALHLLHASDSQTIQPKNRTLAHFCSRARGPYSGIPCTSFGQNVGTYPASLVNWTSGRSDVQCPNEVG